MKLLIDTHVVLWWQKDDRRLNAAARKAIMQADIVWVSAATACEVAIKLSLRKLRVNEPLRVTVGTDPPTGPVAWLGRSVTRATASSRPIAIVAMTRRILAPAGWS